MGRRADLESEVADEVELEAQEAMVGDGEGKGGGVGEASLVENRVVEEVGVWGSRQKCHYRHCRGRLPPRYCSN